MAVTLIVNPGSTSRKYSLFKDGDCVAGVMFEETGSGFKKQVVRNAIVVKESDVSASDFSHSLALAVVYFVTEGDIPDKDTIDSVAIRVVSPGSHFTQHRSIDKEYIHKLRDLEEVAPLHIPGLLAEIHAAQKELPGARLLGVSDSAFHVTIPEHVSTISIPRADAKRFDIKRFGYHGLSCASIARQLESQFGPEAKRVIVCHVGGGVSVTAIKDGKSVNTSMGYSPASGLIMGSRGGDVTGGVVAALTIQKRLRGKKLYQYLYTEAGFNGVAGVKDLRLVLDRANNEDPDAKLGLQMFAHQVRAWVASHAVQMGGVDVIVLTATAAERNPQVRAVLMDDLSLLGVKIDMQKNEALIGTEGVISTDDSKVIVSVLKTDEMGEIERVALELT